MGWIQIHRLSVQSLDVVPDHSHVRFELVGALQDVVVLLDLGGELLELHLQTALLLEFETSTPSSVSIPVIAAANTDSIRGPPARYDSLRARVSRDVTMSLNGKRRC